MDPSDVKILIIDDEPDIVEFLTYNLKKEGFKIDKAYNGREALELVQRVQPHLILLDIMMPEMDGIETCEKIREDPVNDKILIVFLTARSEDYSQIAGFSAGADDYINKPVKPKLLISRLNAILRRYGTIRRDPQENSQVLEFKNMVIDPEKHVVYRNNSELILPRKEFKLLLLLTSKPARVFTREEIFDELWGSEVFVGDRTIDVYVRKLREKLGDDSIKTIKGVGYKFEVL
jgi:two-component system alkaline phosphatase synthesis response regulator PhoP